LSVFSVPKSNYEYLIEIEGAEYQVSYPSKFTIGKIANPNKDERYLNINLKI
jgi:hypothetical protein